MATTTFLTIIYCWWNIQIKIQIQIETYMFWIEIVSWWISNELEIIQFGWIMFSEGQASIRYFVSKEHSWIRKPFLIIVFHIYHVTK